MKFAGRAFVTGNIECLTALHVGGASTGIDIGGVDNIVVRNPLNNQPYIPGSSLRGKLRSLLERAHGLPLTQSIGPQVTIHRCASEQTYPTCPVCVVFGVTSDEKFATPSRLLVRDVALEPQSAERLARLKTTELPYTEVKWEVAIDRITSAANPRQQERVPAGAVFGPFELVFSFYDDDPKQDARRFGYLVEAMQLLEDDYLGGGGSRGSGRIAFTNLSLQVRTAADYRERKARRGLDVSLQGLADLGAEEVVAKLAQTMTAANGGA